MKAVTGGELYRLVTDATGSPKSMSNALNYVAHTGTLVYVGIGCFLAASFAFFMDITSPVHAATQFSFFMAGTNLCESWTAAATGHLAAGFGYPVAFTVLACLSLASLPVLRKSVRSIKEPVSPIGKSPS